MSYDARVFNVMLASPTDVKHERSIAREVIHEWNAVNSQSRGVVLLPIGWESHSSPEMGTSAQEIINKQVADRCDLLVGMFWTRLGTPTKSHASGTIEEIDRHVQSGKPAMIYFSSQPVAPASVDTEQLEELRRFKESCKSDGLYQEYDSVTEFKDKFCRQLQLTANDLFAPTANAEPVESETTMPGLSAEAQVLLKEASMDPNGSILLLRTFGGTSLQTNGKKLSSSNERREIARWEASVQELVNMQLVDDLGKGEIFEVTHLGYRVADMIEL